jgi:hypothetical protein
MAEILSGTFSGTGQSTSVAVMGEFNVELSGVGTVQLERSRDAGANWRAVSRDNSGTLASWSPTAAVPVFQNCVEYESGMLYRLNCTAFTSTVTYRIGKGDRKRGVWTA